MLNIFKKFDPWLTVSVVILYLFGLAEVYALSVTSFDLSLFYRHLIYGAIGFFFYFILALLPYHKASSTARYMYPLLMIALVYLLIFSREVKGSSRWIDFGFFNFQPSEFLKLVVILIIARIVWQVRGAINAWARIIQTFFLVAIPAALVLVQPDLGSSIILFAIWVGILFVSPLRKHYFVYLVVIAIIAAGLGWKFVLEDYQKFRIEVFLSPELDPKGKGYNVNQAIIAVGSGGLLGKGLGNGLQSKLNFLPERQTDFIFATTAEEVGLLGTSIMLALYLVILYRIRHIAIHSKDNLGFYIAYGSFFMLFAQTAINIGMNIGVMPVTGIPLPLFSYGGSALITNLITLGIVQNIALESKLGKYRL